MYMVKIDSGSCGSRGNSHQTLELAMGEAGPGLPELRAASFEIPALAIFFQSKIM